MSIDLSAIRSHYETYGASTPEAHDFLAAVHAWGGKVATRPQIERLPKDSRLDASQPPEVAPEAKRARVKATVAEQPRTAESGWASSPEQVRQKVRLRFHEDYLQLDKEGENTVNWVAQHRKIEAQDDIDLRKNFVRAIVELQASEMSSYALWDKISDAPFDKRIFHKVVAWAEKLTFRRANIIEHNNKRGLQSRYRVNPKVELVIVGKPEPRWPEVPAMGSKTAPEPEVENVADPLKLSDLYVFAMMLQNMNDVLKTYGKPPITEAMTKPLDAQKPNLRHLRDRPSDLIKYRTQALGRIWSVFEDEVKFDKLIGNLTPHSPAYGLLDFIWDNFTTEQDRELVKELMGARWERDHSIEKGCVEVEGRVLVSREGRIIWDADMVAADRSVVAARDVEPEADERSVATTSSSVVPSVSEQSAPTTLEIIEETTATDPKERRGNYTKRRKIEELEAYANIMAFRLIGELNAEHTYKREQIAAVVPSFTNAAVASARGNNIVPRARSHARFTLEQAVHVLVYNHNGFRSLYSHRPNKRIMERVIARATAEATQELAKMAAEELASADM